MTPELAVQREVTKLALSAIGDAGFVLAGSGAIREHGIIQRPTEDVDLFTNIPDLLAFSDSLAIILRALADAGYDARVDRQAPAFARVSVRSRQSFCDELAVDFDVIARPHPIIEVVFEAR